MLLFCRERFCLQPEATVEMMPSPRLPDGFRDLAWRIFFADRQRGISLDAHFPWLTDENSQAWALVARIHATPAAMLVMRRGELAIDGEQYTIAGIGLVCTAASWRGRGFASTLIQAAMEHAGEWADLGLLWTGQQGFYERLGFRSADPMVTGIARLTSANPLHALREQDFTTSVFSKGKVFPGKRGFPPFAQGIRVLSHPSSSAAVAIGQTITGEAPILLEWSGDPDDVLTVLADAGLAMICWNGASGDALAAAALRRGCELDLISTKLAMWRPLSAGAASISALARTAVPVLDRF